MFAKENLYFLLMMATTAVATYTALSFMIGVQLGLTPPNAETMRFAASTLLIPFGAALWAAPNSKAALEGGCWGLIMGLGFTVYPIFIDPAPWADVARNYLIVQRHITDFGFIAFAFVIMATLSGFSMGLGLYIIGKVLRRARKKKHLERLKRR